MKIGDILFARTGASVGKTYHYNKEDGLVYYAGFLIRARINPNVSSEFIFQNTLTSKYKQFIRITSQRSGQPGVNAQEYGSWIISIPQSLSEQQHIGHYFQTLDALIARSGEGLAQLQHIKQASLEKLFPKRGAATPELRFKGFTGDWEEKKVNMICSYCSSSLSTKDVSEKGIYELYDANGVIGYINSYIQTKEYITIIKDGSGVGRTRLLPKNTSFIGTMGGIIPHDNTDVYFLWSILNNLNLQTHVIGATIPHIYFSDYGDEYVMVPLDFSEQQQIGRYFQALDRLIALARQKQDKLKDIKQACLAAMFVNPKAQL